MKDLRNTQRAIHNFLISSYATSKGPGYYTKLIDYLIKQVLGISHIASKGPRILHQTYGLPHQTGTYPIPV